MAGNLQYLKGVRTRFSNALKRELQVGQQLLETDIDSVSSDYCRDICLQIVESMMKINTYSEKLSVQSDKLAQAIGDKDDTLTAAIVEEDTAISDQTMEILCNLQRLESRLKEIKKEKDRFAKEEKPVADEMHRMFEYQLKLQQDFMENQKARETHSSAVKLPKLDIISFNGNKLHWIEFWDSFESAVHKNDKLSLIDKFNYLKSKLSGEARSAIAGYSLTNENYKVAIRTLHERFGDRQEMVDLHYKQLMDISPTRNTMESLRFFLDKVERHLRSLEVLGQDIHQEVFVSMIRRKLPSEVLLQLEILKGTDKKWSVYRLRNILRQFIVAKEVAEKADSMTRKPVNKSVSYQASNSAY